MKIFLSSFVRTEQRRILGNASNVISPFYFTLFPSNATTFHPPQLSTSLVVSIFSCFLFRLFFQNCWIFRLYNYLSRLISSKLFSIYLKKFLNIAIEKRNLIWWWKLLFFEEILFELPNFQYFTDRYILLKKKILWKKKNWISDKNRNVWNETIISGVKNAAHSSQWTRETRDSARFLRDPSSCKHEGPPSLPFLSQLFSRSTPGEHIKAFAPLGIFSCKFPSPE